MFTSPLAAPETYSGLTPALPELPGRVPPLSCGHWHFPFSPPRKPFGLGPKCLFPSLAHVRPCVPLLPPLAILRFLSRSYLSVSLSAMLRTASLVVLVLAAACCGANARQLTGGISLPDEVKACHNSTSQDECLGKTEAFGCFFCASSILPSGCYAPAEAQLLPECECAACPGGSLLGTTRRSGGSLGLFLRGAPPAPDAFSVAMD